MGRSASLREDLTRHSAFRPSVSSKRRLGALYASSRPFQADASLASAAEGRKTCFQASGKFPDFPIVVETFRECLDDDLEMPRLREFLDAVASGAIRVETRCGEIASPFASELVFQFTAAYLYEWDEPRRNERTARGHASVDEDLPRCLCSIAWTSGRGLDPQAVGRVEARLRQRGRLPPLTVEEMSEILRTPGRPDGLGTDRPDGDVREGTQRAEQGGLDSGAGRDPRSPAAGSLAEESGLYDSAFGSSEELDFPSLGNNRQAIPANARPDRTDRPDHVVIPMGRRSRPRLARTLGGFGKRSPSLKMRLMDRAGLRERISTEIQRLTVANRRRESVAVRPEVFADFVAPSPACPSGRSAGRGAKGFELALEQLQGFATTAGFWESEILPRRVGDYPPSRGLMIGLRVDLGGGVRHSSGRDEPLAAIVAA